MLGWTLLAFGMLGLAVPWIVYPAVMAALARPRRPSACKEPANLPRVSVIVATRDDRATLVSRLRNLGESTYPHELVELVVGLDRSLVKDIHVLDDMRQAGVRLTLGDAPGGKAATLNAAVREAGGDILVFADAGQSFRPDAIGHLVEALLADERLGAVSGVLRLRNESDIIARAYRRYESRLRYHESLVHSSIGVVGAIYALRRALWRPLPDELILDDVFVPMRVVLDGHRIGLEPRAVAEERRLHDVDAEYYRKVRTLTGIFQLCAWLPEVLSPRRNPVWLQFTLHKLARFASPLAMLMVLLGLATLIATDRVHFSSRIAVPVLAVAVLLTLTWPRVRRAVMNAFKWTVKMQLATVEATFNGVRGNWKVW